jgi:hypothetical protein
MVDTRSRSTAPGQQDTGPIGDENMDMGNPAENPGEFSSTHTHEDDNLEETLEQRYERMIAQVRLKRMQEGIEALEAELAGDTRAPRIEIAGLPIREKRTASSGPADQPMAQMPRLAKPPTFKGRNLKDAADYETGWKIYFQASRTMPDEQRIAHAATYLEDRARTAWGQEDRPTINTWDEYISWCRSIVVDPVNRKHSALLRLRSMEQRQSQTVRDVVAAIEELEKDIPPMTVEETKAWTLLNALHPDTRTEVLKEHRTITSRDQVIAAAQRQEELRQNKDKGKEKSFNTDNALDKPNARKAHASRGRFRSPHGTSDRSEKGKSPESAKKFSNSFLCYNCGKPGHSQKDCRLKKKESATLATQSKN